MIAGIGDLKTRVILAMGVTFGSLYTALGRLPDWMVNFSRGTITDDEDPANISPRVYLPIILGAILVAVLVGCVAWVIL
ncbi:MAG: hypothetical protein IT423_01605 [Pirellulaceae bacterium]|nr:hypothetical protein [Pirellulaceae bacterium]